jgi:glutamate racemase
VADTEPFPYGEKTRDEVIRYSVATAGRLLSRFSPEVVIVACNTISVAALESLRAAYDIPIVGTVPAIKLASARSKRRKIGLLATERTVRDPYTDALIRDFAPDCEVVRIGDSELIARIERDLITAGHDERLRAVTPSVERFLDAGVDAIVLACTHFLHVDAEIREAAGPGVEIIDSREGVVHQAMRLVPPDAPDADPASAARGVLCVTGGIDAQAMGRYASYAPLFGLSWGGVYERGPHPRRDE